MRRKQIIYEWAKPAREYPLTSPGILVEEIDQHQRARRATSCQDQVRCRDHRPVLVTLVLNCRSRQLAMQSPDGKGGASAGLLTTSLVFATMFSDRNVKAPAGFR